VSARRTAFEQYRRQYAAAFERHELRVDVEGPKVFAFTLRRPDEWMYGVEILCTPVGIVMHGDFTPPSHRGPCGAYMKDLAWFAAEMGADYLAGKFLKKTWTREAALDHVRDNIETLRQGVTYLNDCDDGEQRDDVLTRCARLEAKANAGFGFDNQTDYEAAWAPEWEDDPDWPLRARRGRDSEWTWPDHDYDPAGMAALAVVHATFRRLFWARYETIERVNGGYVLTETRPQT